VRPYQFALKPQYYLAQLSDCHLLGSAEGRYKGIRPARHLAAIVQQLVQQQPDAVLLTGDVTQDHSTESYQLLAQLMAPLRCPVFCLPGNHDDISQLAALCQQAPFRPERSLGLAGWQLLLLNSKGDTPAGGGSTGRAAMAGPAVPAKCVRRGLVVLPSSPAAVKLLY